MAIFFAVPSSCRFKESGLKSERLRAITESRGNHRPNSETMPLRGANSGEKAACCRTSAPPRCRPPASRANRLPREESQRAPEGGETAKKATGARQSRKTAKFLDLLKRSGGATSTRPWVRVALMLGRCSKSFAEFDSLISRAVIGSEKRRFRFESIIYTYI
jgi:hypothetical protein